MSFHDNSTLEFDIESLSQEEQNWYYHCIETINNTDVQVNGTEDEDNALSANASYSIEDHFDTSIDSICKKLFKFSIDANIFGPGVKKTIVAVYS